MNKYIVNCRYINKKIDGLNIINIIDTNYDFLQNIKVYRTLTTGQKNDVLYFIAENFYGITDDDKDMYISLEILDKSSKEISICFNCEEYKYLYKITLPMRNTFNYSYTLMDKVKNNYD